MHEHVMNNQEHIRTFKNIQTYSKELKWLLSCFNLKLSSWQHKKQLGKGIIHSCKIYIVEEETLEGGPKDGGKEELREEEWVSLSTLSLKKTKNMTRLLNFLELKRWGFYVLEWRRKGIYIVVVKKIWMKCHLIRVDKESWTWTLF